MFVEVRNSHPRAEEFIKLIAEFYQGAEIRKLDSTTYIETKEIITIQFHFLKPFSKP